MYDRREDVAWWGILIYYIGYKNLLMLKNNVLLAFPNVEFHRPNGDDQAGPLFPDSEERTFFLSW